MKFDELFNTLMEACYKHSKTKQEAHCGTHGEESGKPDFADIDNDGDKDEPMTQAAKQKKDKEKDGGEKKDKDLSKVPPQLRAHMKKKKK